jgi:nucleoside-diphosphate kinase
MNQFSGVAVPASATLCLIKPHILRNGEAGACISEIVAAGFKIEAFLSIHLSMDIIEHMFDVYRGVYPNYNQMVQHMCSGPCLAIMITSSAGDTSTVSDFRDFCGPFDSQLSKLLRPKSLRAKFGLNTIYNAVHCTDLQDDGQMECEYIFQTLASL